MSFRFRAFGFHLLGSVMVLTLVLGGLYLGWYRWPGWYLTGAFKVSAVLAGVDVVLGPLFTLLVANPAKPRRELARDVAVIVAIQLGALFYGASVLWHGRPLYYTFSLDRLEVVQASDLSPEEVRLARQANPSLAPHWYSRPRWVWAPLPDEAAERDRIVASALSGGDDIIDMPRYFQPWERGFPALRSRLRPVAQQNDVRLAKKRGALATQVRALGEDPAQPTTLLMTGRAGTLLAVFDPRTLAIRALLRADL